MTKKSQATFEYVILLAGAILVVVLGVVVFRSYLFTPASQSVVSTNCFLMVSKNPQCHTGSKWNPCGQVNRAQYPLSNGVQCGSTQTPPGCSGSLPEDKLWCGAEYEK